MSRVDLAVAALRRFNAMFSQLDDADRAEVMRQVQLPDPGYRYFAEHAFAVSRPYPRSFRWACICGHDIHQGMGESAADIHARLLAHVNGEDGLTLCPTACSKSFGKCSDCPGRAR